MERERGRERVGRERVRKRERKGRERERVRKRERERERGGGRGTEIDCRLLLLKKGGERSGMLLLISWSAYVPYNHGSFHILSCIIIL